MLAPWAQEQVLKYLFTADTLATRPTDWHAALHTGNPGTGADNEVTSGADANYARAPVDFTAALDGTSWDASSIGDVIFPQAGAGANYTVTHLSVKTASTAGETLVIIPLPVPIPVVADGVISIPLGQLIIEGGI